MAPMRTGLRRTRLRKDYPPQRKARLDTSRGCWSMVLVDGEPIRKKARKNYEKLLRDLAKCKAEIERFEAEDHPRFLRWFNATFGSQLTTMRELHQRLSRAKSLVEEVQAEQFYGRHRSMDQAYRKVMRRMEEEENAPPPPPPGANQDGASSTDEEEQFFRDREEAFREFASAFGFELDDDFALSPRKEPERSSRLKELYRAVVRRLHPDKAGNLSPKEIEWWHQAQGAYEARNEEQLELILTLCEIEDRGTKETSVSRLGQIVAHFKSSLRALKRRLNDCKRDPAWNFSKVTDHEELRRQGKRTFEAQMKALLVELIHYETLVDKWKAQAAAPRRKQEGRARHFVEEEFLF